MLAAIAAGDPEGHIVVPEQAEPPGLRVALEDRWRRSYPILLQRVVWTPRVDAEAFLAQLDRMDVLLDPLHFGSGYTFHHAMALGVPMVTWPGAFARGRVVAGAYRQMGAGAELVAATMADYVSIALAIGEDPARRARLREALRLAARRELFGDMQAAREVEDFFAASVVAAATTLPAT